MLHALDEVLKYFAPVRGLSSDGRHNMLLAYVGVRVA